MTLQEILKLTLIQVNAYVKAKYPAMSEHHYTDFDVQIIAQALLTNIEGDYNAVNKNTVQNESSGSLPKSPISGTTEI